MRRVSRFLVVAMALGFAPGAASATDGHFLHGVGAINAAMGGVGVAAPNSLLGAFYLNPAGLLAFEGTRFEFGFEMFKPDRTVTSQFPGMPGAAATASSSEFVPIPAMAWSSTFMDGRLAVGVAGLAIGGFGVDYGADPQNPILAPRPMGGFGQVYSNFGLMKLAPSLAFAVTPDLWVGASAHVNWASLAVDPMPVGAPSIYEGADGVPGTQDDVAFYPRATDADGAFGFGFQAGVIYRPLPALSLGASFTSEQYFEDFEYHCNDENPFSPTFGQPLAETLTFSLDLPMIISGGIALRPTPDLLVAGDARYYFYEQTNGFAERGFNPDGSVAGFGWQNILAVGGGVEYTVIDQLALRGGYHYSQNPIPDEQSMFNLPAPAIVQHHLTLGAGIRPNPAFEVSIAYYRAFENSITGPVQTPLGPMPQTSVGNAMSENSFLVQFSFAPGGIR